MRNATFPTIQTDDGVRHIEREPQRGGTVALCGRESDQRVAEHYVEPDCPDCLRIIQRSSSKMQRRRH